MNVHTKLNISPFAIFRSGYWFTLGVLCSLAVGAAGLVLVNAVVSPGGDSSDPPGGHSNMRIYTDHLTGCQYLRGPSGGLTPRMGKDGKQLCEGAK